MTRATALALLLLAAAGCAEPGARPEAPAPAPAPPGAPAPEVAPPPAPAPDKAQALQSALAVEPLASLPEDGRVVIRARLKNVTDREIRPSVSWEAQGTWWQGEKAAAAPVPPGSEGVIEIHAKVGRRLFPLPIARIELADGQKKVFAWDFLDRAVAGVAPMLREWNVAGPFDLGLDDAGDADRQDRDRYVKGALPGWRDSLPPERGVDLAAAYAGKGGRHVRWQAARARADGLVDLAALYRADGAVACAVAYVHSPAAAQHAFFVGSDDSILVRIGGKEVWKKHAQRPAKADEDYFAADLAEGWNEVLVKAANRAGAWGFYFRVIDPERRLKFALKPERQPVPAP